MAAICTTVNSLSRSPPQAAVITSKSPSSAFTSSSSPSISTFYRLSQVRRMTASQASPAEMMIVCMAPDEEKLTRRNPLDFPVEDMKIIDEIDEEMLRTKSFNFYVV